MEKVSIIIPIYNGEKYLEQTLLSCIKQSYSEIEIILVNDASTDGSEEIIKRYFDQENLKYAVNEVNMGMMRSCNKGVSLSSGAKILVLGQDDILPEHYIEEAMKCFDENIGFVFCNPRRMDEKGKRGEYIYTESVLKEIRKDLLFHIAKSNVIPSTGLIMDRISMLECGGYDEKYRNYGEWLLWIRMLSRKKVNYVENIHSDYRTHPENMTTTFMNSQKQKKDLELQRFWLECQKEAIVKLPIVWYKKIYLMLRYIYKVLLYIRNKITEENGEKGERR